MTLKPQIITAIDVGTSKIATIVARIFPSHDEKGKSIGETNLIEIVGFGVSATQGVRKGVVIHIDDVSKSISDSVAKAEKMSGYQIKNALVSISGAHLQGINSSGMVPIKTKEVRQSDIQSVIEVAKAIPLNQERELIHVLLQDFIVDGQDGVKKPLGISGSRLEAKVHIVTGQSSNIQNLIKSFNKSGISVNDIIVSPVSSSRNVVTEEEKESGVCVIDIGAGTTDLTIFEKGAVVFTTSLPIGGNHISNDISIGLKIPLLVADKIKTKYGCALKALIGKNESIEIVQGQAYSNTSNNDVRTNENPITSATPTSSIGTNSNNRVFSKYSLAEIIEARMREIFSHIIEILPRGKDAVELSSGIVLVGGCANLIGITQLAEQKFRLPVRIGTAVPLRKQQERNVKEFSIISNEIKDNHKTSSSLGEIDGSNFENHEKTKDNVNSRDGRKSDLKESENIPTKTEVNKTETNIPDMREPNYKIIGITDAVNSPEFSSIVGMLIYALDTNTSYFSATNTESSVGFAKRLVNWFSEHF